MVVVERVIKDSFKVDMKVKKIEGNWKLDGSKILPIEHDKKNAPTNKSQLKQNSTNDYLIERKYIENENDSALKVVQSAPNEAGPFVDETDDRYIIIEDKKIYIIVHGEIEKILHQTKEYMDGEYAIKETKEGYTLSAFDNLTLSAPDQDKVTYEVELVPISEVYLQDQYVR